MAGVLASARMQAERTKKKMKELGAISEETGKTPKKLGVAEWFLKSGMAHFCGIKKKRWRQLCDEIGFWSIIR